jgi:excisionase family DNA binding protein
MAETLIAKKAAAAQLGISVRTLEGLMYRRLIEYVKVGGSVRFRPSALDRYVADQTVSAR